MSLVTRFAALVRRFRHRNELDADLEEELRSYAEELAEQKAQRSGLSREEARRGALIEMGGIEQLKEVCRDTRSFAWLDSIAADIRYGLRSLVKAPGFFLAVALTLGPGLGLNTALFSVFDGYFLQPQLIRDPSSVFEIVWQYRHDRQPVFTTEEVDALRAQDRILDQVVSLRQFPTRIGGNPMFGQLVSANYFATLGIGTVNGRWLLPEDSKGAAVVLSDGAWRSRFGADPSILGRTIHLRGHPVEVVGVAPPGFTGPTNLNIDFWAPIELTPLLFDDKDPTPPLQVIGKLHPGVTFDEASSALEVWARQHSSDQQRLFLVPLATKLSLKNEFKKPAPFFVAFGLIILMACANVSNMMLARAVSRQREMGIRISLGAPRARLIRQLLVESVLVALPASLVGLAISAAALTLFRRAILSTVPPDFAFFFTIPVWTLDFQMVAYVILAGIGSAVVFGLIPAVQVTRTLLTQASRGDFGIVGLPPSRLRNMLVVGQVAVCVLLLICTTVVLHSRQYMAGQKLGIRTQGVFDIRVPDRLRAIVAERIRQKLPGVQEGAAWRVPLYGRLRSVPVTPMGENAMTVPSGYNFVSPEYFSILEIPIVAGRNFTGNEAREGAASVIVSEGTARLFWPGRSPLGQVLKIAKDKEGVEKPPPYSSATVVGVVRDVVSGNVGDSVDHTCLYFPTSLVTQGVSLMLRTTAGAGTLDLAKAEIERVAPEAAEYIVPMDDLVVVQLYPFRLIFWICNCLAGLALLLSVTGIYGVLAYVVNQRSREFGIRMALGANAMDLIGLVLAQCLRLAGWGAALGILLAAAISPVFAHKLEALNPYDGVAYVIAAVLAGGASLGAALGPSRRAARVDPARSLRCD